MGTIKQQVKRVPVELDGIELDALRRACLNTPERDSSARAEQFYDKLIRKLERARKLIG